VVLGTFISNLFTLPGILAFQYMTGRWVFLKAGFNPTGIGWDTFLAKHLPPLLIGSFATALVAGIAGYAGVWVVLGWRGRRMIGGVV
jgi:uncharacterized protein (DUF2062 family)